MMRGIWLALPLFLIVALDGGLTLLGQPAAYWHGNLSAVNEANPVGIWFLNYGPKAFTLALTGWAGLVLLLSSALPGLLGRAFYGAVLLGHAAGALSWASYRAKGVLHAGAVRLGGSALLEGWASSPNANLTLPLCLLVLVPLFTAFCWARSGVLAEPKAAKKPAAKDDKEKGK